MFDSRLIARAEVLFYKVFNDGDRVRIYRTPWCYEYANEHVFHSNEALNEFIEDEINDLMEIYEADELEGVMM